MNDEYITKAQVIEVAESLRNIAGDTITNAFIKGIESIEDVRKDGTWKLFKLEMGWYGECSECGAVFPAGDAAIFNACPICAAIMTSPKE